VSKRWCLHEDPALLHTGRNEHIDRVGEPNVMRGLQWAVAVWMRL